MSLSSCFAETRNLRMHYLQSGVGHPVVFIHGYPQTSYAWRHQLSHLGTGFACFAPDLRGFGATDKPGVRVTRELVATDIIRLFDCLGIERAAVVGHDWGGIVAFKLAVDWPERVSAVAMLDAPCTVWSPNADHGYWFKVADYPEEFFREHHAEFIECVLQGGDVPAHWPGAPATPWREALRGRTYRPWVAPDALAHYQQAISDPMAQWHGISYYRDALPFHVVEPHGEGERFRYLSPADVATLWVPSDSDESAAVRQSYLDFAPEDRHKTYPGPALWLRSMGDSGRKKRVSGTTPYTEAFARHFSQLEVGSVDGGHFFPEERPVETTAALRDFLARATVLT